MRAIERSGASGLRTRKVLRRLTTVWGGLAVVLLALAGCGGAGTEGGLSVTAEFDPTPPTVGPTSVELSVATAEGEPVTDAEVAIEANMNHAGMVPEFAEARAAEPGRYEAEFEFTMAGDWFLLVTVRTADGEEVQETVPVPGVRPSATE